MVKKIRRGGKILFWNDKNITSVNIKRKRKNPKYFRLTSDGVVLPCFDGGDFRNWHFWDFNLVPL